MAIGSSALAWFGRVLGLQTRAPLPREREREARPRNAAAAPADAGQRPLGASFLELRHVEHGRLVISQGTKAPGSNEVRFALRLVPREGPTIVANHAMIVCGADPSRGGMSTARFIAAGLPVPMQGRSAGSVYAVAAALAAMALGVQRVVITNASEPRLLALCRGLGMDSDGPHACGFELDPHALYRNALRRCVHKGWR